MNASAVAEGVNASVICTMVEEKNGPTAMVGDEDAEHFETWGWSDVFPYKRRSSAAASASATLGLRGAGVSLSSW